MKNIKEIKEMGLEELHEEIDELWPYLYMAKETSTCSNGMD